ncbi:helicase-associated domain-containing protein [Promicromonospora sp. Marseille-Q5078]
MASTSPRGTAEADVAGGAGATAAPRTFTEAIRTRDDDALLALLRARPDLATPSPSTLRSLAARASSRTALERAIAHADARTLQALEAVVALSGDAPVTPDDVRHAVGADEAGPTDATEPADPTDAPDPGSVVERVLADALAAALLWDAGDPGHPDLRPAPGLDDVLGPHPAGLGPVRPAERRTSSPSEGRKATEYDARPEDLPPGGREVLDALAWGPPIGLVPAPGTPAREAVDALVDARLLLRTDARHVTLPRDVGLALRGGRTHRAPELVPPRPGGRSIPQVVADGEAASAALDLVRRVDLLVAAWDEAAPPVLRSGGLGVRDLRRTAQALGADEARTAFVVELAAAAGVVADDGEAPPSYRPTTVADAWEGMDDAERWALLASAWAASRRTPWLVGSRDEKGALRAPLSGDLHRGWVPRLRRQVLDVLAAQPGTALDLDAVMTVLRWHAPRTVPPEQAVAGLLAEAALLGATGAGALSGPGAAVRDGAGRPALEAAMRDALPPEVDEVLLQGDLTGIVPGRPSQALAVLLGRSADVESRGAATTVRFSPASVTRALDHGTTADELLDALARRSRVPVPQPLEYLVRDTARRHESLRVGSAGSYVRAADPAVLAGLAADPRLAHLGLVRLAPTVLAASVPAVELHDALRARGLLSAVEGPDGRVLSARLRRPPRLDRGSRDARRGPSAEPEPTSDDGRAALVARLRAADSGDETAVDRLAGARPPAPAAGGGRPGTNGRGSGANGAGANGAGANGARAGGRTRTPEPGDALATLHDALRDGRLVWIEMVGASGTLERRALKPLRLDGGRLRALDPAREAELTVAVHRIAAVEPADG